MPKCYQTKNVFGYPLNKCSGDEREHRDENTTVHSKYIHYRCDSSPTTKQNCTQHVPIYDEFYGFVAEVLENAKMLPD